MGRTCLVAAAVLVVAVVGLTPPVDARPGGKLKIGLPKGMFRDVPPAVVEAAALPFRDLFKRQAGLDGEVEIHDDAEALAAAMKNKTVDIGLFSGFEFSWVRGANPEIVPIVLCVPLGKKLQACLVIHKDAKAKKPADLCGDCVAIPANTRSHCHLFLERLRADLPADTCGTVKTEPKGPEDTLDGVVGGKHPAALVDIGALVAYQNNKPGAYNVLKVLAESELFPPGVIAYRKDAIPTATVNQIHAGLTKAAGTPQGRAMLMLWKMKGFEDIPADFDAEMKRIYKAYPPPAPPK